MRVPCPPRLSAGRRRLLRPLFGCLLAAAAAMPPVYAATGEPPAGLPPQVRTLNGISYVSGGIGTDEAAAMRRMAGRFKVRMHFVDSTDGSALSDVSVTLFNERREIVLLVLSEGPYLFLDLPPGTYRAVVRYGPELSSHRIRVDAGKDGQDLLLRFPGSADKSILIARPQRGAGRKAAD